MRTALLFFAFWLGVTGGAVAGTLFVSPQGDDSAPGTAEQPLRSLAGARDAIRVRRTNGGAAAPDNGWTVLFAPGVYPMTAPVVFESRDSGTEAAPVIYRGADTEVVFSGGKNITGWREITDGPWRGVWVANLPQTDGRADYFEQLFVNGRRATRARHPNAGFFSPEKIEQDAPIDKDAPPVPFTAQRLVAKPGDLDAVLGGVVAEELRFSQLVVHHHWDTTRRIPLAFDPATRALHCQGQPMKHWNPWRASSLYYVENLRAAFDAPGEWFYDGAAGKVFYRPMPGEKITSSFVIPRGGLRTLLEVRGAATAPVSFVRFENLAFAHTDTPRDTKLLASVGLPVAFTGPLDAPGPSQFEPAQAAFYTGAVVEMSHVRDIAVVDCEISRTGEYALWLRDAERCRIERCAFTDLGAGAVRLGHNASGNRVDNCILRRGGRFHASAVGLWIGNDSSDNEITNNEISDFYYTGISVGWTWGYKGGSFRNQILFNRVHKLGQGAMADMGGVYTLGTSHGTRVANNVFFDIQSYAYGGWGLYTDEGSEGIVLENNLVYDTTDGSFHQHYGKKNIIRNNILAFSKQHQVAASRVEGHRSFTFERNIIIYDQGACLGSNAARVNADWRANLWWRTNGTADFAGKTHAAWQAAGNDAGGVVADPGFVNAARRDFRLKADSPVGKIGFVPFDFTQVGVYGDAKWRAKARED